MWGICLVWVFDEVCGLRFCLICVIFCISVCRIIRDEYFLMLLLLRVRISFLDYGVDVILSLGDWILVLEVEWVLVILLVGEGFGMVIVMWFVVGI